MHQVHWFDDIHRHHKKQIGLKAYRLAELYKADVPIPYGFVIPSQALAALFGHRIIKSRNTVNQFPQWASPIVSACRMMLSTSLLAVRSSFSLEDGVHSYAGQAATVLGVSSVSEALMALRSVWASMIKLHPEGRVSGGIILQPMIEAEVSGVALSSHPTDPSSQAMLLEAIYGLASPLMKGTLTPDRVTVDAAGHVLSYNLHLQPEALMVRYGKLNTVPLPSNKRQGRTLSPEMISQLFDLVVSIRKEAGADIEVEWAFAKHKWWVLQVRTVATERRKTRLVENVVSKPLASGLPIAPGQVRARVASEDPSQWSGKVVFLSKLTPSQMPALTKAAAIVSTRTGWMRPEAVLGRELEIPTIMGVASHSLSAGQLVTVDATKGKVYQAKPQTVTENLTLPKGVMSLTELDPSRSLWANATTPLQLDRQVVMAADGFVTDPLHLLSQWYFGKKLPPPSRLAQLCAQNLGEWITSVGSDRQIVIPIAHDTLQPSELSIWVDAVTSLHHTQPHQITFAVNGDLSHLNECQSRYRTLDWMWWVDRVEPLVYLDKLNQAAYLDLDTMHQQLSLALKPLHVELSSRLTSLMAHGRWQRQMLVRPVASHIEIAMQLSSKMSLVVDGIEFPKALISLSTNQ